MVVEAIDGKLGLQSKQSLQLPSSLVLIIIATNKVNHNKNYQMIFNVCQLIKPGYNQFRCGSLAQLVEQETLNLLVVGSIPTRPISTLTYKNLLNNCGDKLG